MNYNARHERDIVVNYDDLSDITSLSAKLYDKNGNLIEKYKMKDFQDLSAYDGSMYSDNRLKYLSITYDNYPFTIDFSYEKEINGLMFYPNHVFNSSEAAIEESSFIIESPVDMDLKYKLVNAKEPSIEVVDGIRTYQWSYRNLNKLDIEPFSPPLREQLIRVETSPVTFEFGGFQGKMDTWNGLGKFQNNLNNALDPLPLEAKQAIYKLTSDLNSDEDRIAAVYKYLQNNFRYVSVQLGVGGWQPFSPKFVYENGYGDCKALSFYTKSLLESIDIPAYYTLVSAGDSYTPLDPNFPTRNFNHVILCVPNKGDTVWLECTSQTNPIGYAGNFTGDRKVLLVTENGGKVVKTPSYDIKDNLKNCNGHIEIDENGDALANINIYHKGLAYEDQNLDFAIHYSNKEQETWLYNTIDIPDFEIISHSIENIPSPIPEATIYLSLRTNDFVSTSAKRMILNPSLINRLDKSPAKVENRKSDVFIQNEFFNTDSLTFSFPEGFIANFIPENDTIDSEFGSYSSYYSYDGKDLLYIRKFSLKKIRLPSTSYEDFRSFIKEVSDADGKKVLLSRK